MAERTEITQVTQIGLETTPGTAVAAGKRLPGLTIDLSANPETKAHRPRGYKYPTVQALNREWSKIKASGQPTYDEIAYLLNSVLGTGVITGASANKTHTFSPGTRTADTPKTFTIENGSAVRAHRAAYGLFTGTTLKFSREEIEVSAEGIAQQIEDGVTLTASPAEVAQVPILPGHLDVYLDTTSGGLGGTQLLRVLKGEIKVANRFGPLWVVNSSLGSWATHVEVEPDVTTTLTLEADAQGMALLTSLRAGDTGFLRVEATGGTIPTTAVPYSLTWDMATKVQEIGDFSDEQGVYAIEFTLGAYHDETWGKAQTAVLVNTLAAL